MPNSREWRGMAKLDKASESNEQTQKRVKLAWQINACRTRVQNNNSEITMRIRHTITFCISMKMMRAGGLKDCEWCTKRETHQLSVISGTLMIWKYLFNYKKDWLSLESMLFDYYNIQYNMKENSHLYYTLIIIIRSMTHNFRVFINAVKCHRSHIIA